MEATEQIENDLKRRAELMRLLLAEGLIKEIKPPCPLDAPGLDFEPIKIKGRPISEEIIEDRR